MTYHLKWSTKRDKQNCKISEWSVDIKWSNNSSSQDSFTTCEKAKQLYQNSENWNVWFGACVSAGIRICMNECSVRKYLASHSTCVYSFSFICCHYHAIAGCNNVYRQKYIHHVSHVFNPIYTCGPACRALALFRFIILLKPRICNAMHEQWIMNECSLGITLYFQERDVGS